jgi:1-acyl-sn-glycerol-3-phosphate acyltransferase
MPETGHKSLLEMKVLISIWIWIAGMSYFVVCLFFILVCTYILPERIYDPWMKKMMRFLFVLTLTKVEAEGLRNVKPGNTYLFMANHVSLFDLFILGGYIPGIVRGVEAHSHHSWPLYGWVSRRLGNIPIERESVHNSMSSFRRTLRLMNNGRSMIILPEGHRTLDGQLKPFKKLPFMLAQQAGTGIIPIGLSGMYHLKRKGNWMISPTKIKISFGQEVTPEQISSLSIGELRDYVQTEIGKLIERP